jgi:glucan phosphoethanolaminetransferase (alkaline phosphatase superfamily)
VGLVEGCRLAASDCRVALSLLTVNKQVKLTRWSALSCIVLTWALPLAAFAYVYIAVFARSLSGTLAHCAVMLSTIFTALSGIALLSVLIGRPRFMGSIGVLVTTAWLLATSTFYGAVFVGLSSWGRVPTAMLMATYLDQLGPLLRVLSISPLWAVLGAAILVALALVCSVIATRRPWQVLLVANISGGSSSSRHIRFLLPLLVFVAMGGISWQVWAHFVLFTAAPLKDELWHLVLEPVPIASAHAQSLVFERLGDLRRVSEERIVQHGYKKADVFAKRNIILITVDALRPDHMGVYGYYRETTPYLSALASRGAAITVKNARSACAESSCGLLSLLTGKQPHEILTTNFGLMNVLLLHGYRRTILASGDHTNFYKLKDYYGTVELYRDGSNFTGSGYVNDDYELIKQVSGLPNVQKDEPQFLFVHLMSVHGLGLRHPEHLAWQPARSIYHYASKPDDDGIQQAINFYDNGVLQADFIIKRILSDLESKGYVNEDAIILVTADHGESLGEHGVRTHAESLYDAVIRIPWIWIGRAPTPHRSNAVVQADFAPTVLSELGIPVPSHWSGIPLQRTIAQRQTFHAQAPEAAVISTQDQTTTKLIYDFRKRVTNIFDVETDPRELSPRAVRTDSATEQSMIDALIKNGYGDFSRNTSANAVR